LAKINRLTSKKDFALVKMKGKVFQEKTFALAVLDRGEGDSRFGFVISTKISKRAVKRNKAKRLLRAVIQKKIKIIKKGYDVVFLAKAGVLDLDNNQAGEEVGRALKSAGLFV
ncbi:MAG: ribonuclease P protein component, partial [Patescibacteria group bacterium]